jgi:hypothetical protein
LEGVITIPGTATNLGPWAGKIVTGSENGAIVYTISTNGTVVAYTNLNIHPEDFKIIPTNQDLYLAGGTDPNSAPDRILKVSHIYFANDVGNLLIVQESIGGARLFIVRWDGTNFVQKFIPFPQGLGVFEHVTFAPINLPAQ